LTSKLPSAHHYGSPNPHIFPKITMNHHQSSWLSGLFPISLGRVFVDETPNSENANHWENTKVGFFQLPDQVFMAPQWQKRSRSIFAACNGCVHCTYSFHAFHMRSIFRRWILAWRHVWLNQMAFIKPPKHTIFI
jgi:hypothetical protein